MKILTLVLLFFSTSVIYAQIPPIDPNEKIDFLEKPDSIFYYPNIYAITPKPSKPNYLSKKKIIFNTGILLKIIFEGHIGLYGNVTYKPFKELEFSLLGGIEGSHRYYHIPDAEDADTKKIRNHYNILAQMPLGMGWQRRDYDIIGVYLTVSPYIHTFKETIQLPFSNYTVQRKTSGWNLGLMYSHSSNWFNFQWHIGIIGLDQRRYILPFWNLKIGVSL